jgi:glycosyltransferase involved in cell wall biosynthesis
MVSKALVRGAYQRKLEELAALPDIDLTLVTPPYWTDSGHRVALEKAYVRGYRMVVLPIRFDGRFHLYHYLRLGDLLRTVRPDIVHADEEPYNLATALILCGARQVGARSLFFTWQNIPRGVPPPFRQIESYCYAAAGYAIAGTGDAEAVLRAKGYRGRIAVIPQFGFDPDLFSPRGPSARSEVVIGYVGRLIEAKGILDLLNAVARLPETCRLQIVGEGPLLGAIELEAGRLGIAGRVTVQAEVPSTKVGSVIAGFDVLVLPSRTTPTWKEQFGRVLVEAMLCEVAVVGSSSAEIPNVIGDAGVVFPEGDVDALTAALASLAWDASERHRLGKAGRERALRQFTQRRIAEATYDVYKEMMLT